MIWKLLAFVKKYKWQFFGGLLLATLTILTGMGLMGTSGYLISRAAERPLITDLFMVTAAVRFFGLSRSVVRYFERLVSHDLTFRILLSMRKLLFAKLDAMSAGWMMRRNPGDLLHHLVADIERMQNAFIRQIIPSIAAVLISIFCCLFLGYFDPALALAAMIFLLISGIGLSMLAIRMSHNKGTAEVVKKSEMQAFLVDKIQGLQEMLWMGVQQDDNNRFAEIQTELDNLQKKSAGNHGLLEGLNLILTHLGALAVLLLAIPLVASGEINGVMLALMTLVVLSSFEAVQNLATAFLNAEATNSSARRFFSILDEKAPDNWLKNKKSKTKIGKCEIKNYGIEFHDVSFSYEEEHVAIEGISLTISEGSRTAIVGPVGSGKSTLINLLLRFWDVGRGQITFGGCNINHFDMEYFRSKFAVMAQDTYVFNRSIRDNLLIAKPEASDDELINVLSSVGLGSFTSNLNLLTGSLGMRLSGGERQLLALARMLLKDAPLWVFDEPTAHLDANTERRILNHIWQSGRNHTRIMITHRLLDMDKMDQILVMDRGRLVERGAHRELMEADTLYRSMYLHQQNLLG